MKDLFMAQRLLSAVMLVTVLTSQTFAEKFLLPNGDQITGRVIQQDEKQIVIEHPVLGQLTLPVTQVKIVPPPTAIPMSQPAATVKPVAEQTLPNEQTIKPLGWASRLRETWDSKLEIGASTQTGNTEQSAIYLRFKTTEKNNQTQTDLDAAYDRQAKENDATANKFTTGVRREWFVLNSKWSRFGQGRWDYDDFQSWDKRLSGAVGVGYQWLDTPKWKLNFQLGLGAAKEFGSNNEEIRPELLGGFKLGWEISENQRFGAGSTYYPDISDPQQFRVVSDAHWLLKINNADGISLKIGLANEYQSEVDPGKKHDDFRLFSTLVFDF